MSERDVSVPNYFWEFLDKMKARVEKYQEEEGKKLTLTPPMALKLIDVILFLREQNISLMGQRDIQAELLSLARAQITDLKAEVERLKNDQKEEAGK